MIRSSFVLFSLLSVISSFLAVNTIAHAHEIYVLSPESFSRTFTDQTYSLLSPLANPGHRQFLFSISALIFFIILLYTLFSYSQFARRCGAWLEGFSWIGYPVLRITFGCILLYSALTSSFPGPELPLSSLSSGVSTIRILLLLSGLLLTIGLASELAAGIAVALFVSQLFLIGPYLLTYSHYLALALVFFFFGSRHFSIDGILFSSPRRFRHLHELLIPILRFSFGFSLLFTAISIKILHPAIPLAVVEQYHLTQFHYLFPNDAGLIVLGATLAEITIALFIMFGFQLRLSLFVLFFYNTLSLWYFGEVEWPHYGIYAFIIAFFVFPPLASLDAYLPKTFLAWRSRRIADAPVTP
ncbi:MAG: hypothetical protein RIQ54_281 [Candidatus Parcubacteria bacterium]